VAGFRQSHYEGHPQHTIGVIFVKGLRVSGGDSGAPVWDPHTGASIGLVSGNPHPNSPNSVIQPLRTTHYGMNNEKKLVGALDAEVMGEGSLNIIQGG
jgi:hypothetical protein